MNIYENIISDKLSMKSKKKIKKRHILRLNSYSVQEEFYLVDNIIVTVVIKRDNSEYINNETIRFYTYISHYDDNSVCVKSIWKPYMININYENEARKLMKINPYISMKEISVALCCSYNKARILYGKLRREFSGKR